MNKDEEEKFKKALEFFDQVCDLKGVAVSKTTDGFILKFKVDFLKSLIEKHGDKPEIMLVIHQPEFKN